ncbi:hypothetical protein K469DRAFT_563272, partial [Zopfia rhizophila CBS 207.26]
LPSPIVKSIHLTFKGASTMASNAQNYQHKLFKTQAAEIAREKRRKRKRQVVSKGEPIYVSQGREMVQQRWINKIRALEEQLEAKKLKEHNIILNRWKRLHPTIRNHARMYLKRVESG